MDESGLQKVQIGDLSGEILARYSSPAFLQALSKIQELVASAPEVLLIGRNRVVVLNIPFEEARAEKVVVKEFRPRGVVRIRALLAGSKARRSFYGALTLMNYRINTPEPIAYLENKSRWRAEFEYYLAKKIKEAQEIRFIFRQFSPPQLQFLLQQLADFLRLVHGQGIIHRDLSDGNILVKTKSPQAYEFFLLDPNRVKRKKRVGRLIRLKNLIRLGIPASWQGFFLKAYLQVNRLPPFLWRWYRLHKLIYTYWISLKKFLRLRALARRLRWQ